MVTGPCSGHRVPLPSATVTPPAHVSGQGERPPGLHVRAGGDEHPERRMDSRAPTTDQLGVLPHACPFDPSTTFLQRVNALLGRGIGPWTPTIKVRTVLIKIVAP